MRKELDLSFLDGVRCWTCLAVILLHVHSFEAGSFFAVKSPCIQRVNNTPILGRLVSNVSFQMSSFWLLSGLLCEHQLSQLQAKQLGSSRPSIGSYLRFILNRLARLYPLFLLKCLETYRSSQTRPELPQDIKCSLPNLVRTMLCVNSPFEAVLCSNVGWSVPVDVHGYLVIAASHMLVSQPKIRKQLWILWYICALLWSARDWLALTDNIHSHQAARQHIHEFGLFGIQHLPEGERIFMDVEQLNPSQLHLDIDDPFYRQVRTYLSQWMQGLYYTSIHKHGSAMILGSLLYLNLQDRKGGNFSIWKLVFATGIAMLTNFQPNFIALSVYLLLDVLLSCTKKLSGWQRFVFSNPMWTFLAPYTYGIYLTSFTVVLTRASVVHKEWMTLQQIVDRGDGKTHYNCGGYGASYVLVETICVFAICMVLSIALHYTVEWPFTYIRKRWLQQPYFPSLFPKEKLR